MNLRPISDRLAIADQPDVADLEALKADGYVGVVNLRNDGEPEQPLSTAAEGEKVRALGLDYLHYGVGGRPLDEEGVAGVIAFLDSHADGKVLLHCRKGGRAAALALIHRAKQESWPAAEALTRGAAEGMPVEGNLRAVVQEYLDSQS